MRDYASKVTLRTVGRMIDEGTRAGEIVRYWAVGFFRATLQGGELPGPTGDPEVTLESWPPPDRGMGTWLHGHTGTRS